MTTRTISLPPHFMRTLSNSSSRQASAISPESSVTVHITARTFDLSYDEDAVGLDQIIGAIEGVGYEVSR